MKYRIHMSEAAISDVVAIKNYIGKELGSPMTADQYVDRIESAIATLEYMPERNRLMDKEPWKTMGFRLRPVGSYIVVYRVLCQSAAVEFIRIYSSRRNIPGLLEEQFVGIL